MGITQKKRNNMKKITEELIADIKKLRSEGMTYSKIAETLGVGKTTATKYGKTTTKPKVKTIDVAKTTNVVEIEDVVIEPIKKLLRKEVVGTVKLTRKERKAIRKRLRNR